MNAERTFEVEGWTIQQFAAVDSTNLLAAKLPVWHAVIAEVQTAGRGRFQRTWISDSGGLWLSAVVPWVRKTAAQTSSALADSDSLVFSSGKPKQGGLPLVAGLALCEALRELGVSGFRMRWPNDVLVDNRKLAGLLLEQFAPDRVVVGIGLNVQNEPEASDPSLKNQATRLTEWVSPLPKLTELAALVLRHLRLRVLEASQEGFEAMLPRINALWGAPREIELLLDDASRRGVFTSVDENGCLLLEDKAGQVTAYDPIQVRHVQEVRSSAKGPDGLN